MADVVSFPTAEPESRIPTLPEARAMAAERVRVTREGAGLTIAEWARVMTERLGYPVTQELAATWERPTGPQPGMAEAIIIFAVGNPRALAIGSRLLGVR